MINKTKILEGWIASGRKWVPIQWTPRLAPKPAPMGFWESVFRGFGALIDFMAELLWPFFLLITICTIILIAWVIIDNLIEIYANIERLRLIEEWVSRNKKRQAMMERWVNSHYDKEGEK